MTSESIRRYTDPRRLLRCDEELPKRLFFSGTLAENEYHLSVTAVDVRILELRLQAMDFPTAMPTCHRVPQVNCISILEWKSLLCDLQSKTEILAMSSWRILINNISLYIFHHFLFLFLLRSMSRYHSVNHLRSPCKKV